MTAVLSLLIIITLSILVTRIATVILVHTGLSREMARFQARSAFSGAGFTTNESEKIVNHPVRRRVVSTLILLGNAGIATAIASLLLTFIDGDDFLPRWSQVVLLAIGVVALWFAATSKLIDRWLSGIVSRWLARHTSLSVVDVDSLLHLAQGYRIRELNVSDHGDWLADRTLREADLRHEGVNVLAVSRANGAFIGAPTADTRMEAGDTLICYGQAEVLEELNHRARNAAGDRSHEEQISAERQRRQEQEAEEQRLAARQAAEEKVSSGSEESDRAEADSAEDVNGKD